MLRAAAVLQPGRVVVIFQHLHLIGEAERRAHAHLVIRLVLAVSAHSLTLAAEHRGQGILPCHLGHIVRDAVLIAPALVPRLASGRVFLFSSVKFRVRPALTTA